MLPKYFFASLIIFAICFLVIGSMSILLDKSVNNCADNDGKKLFLGPVPEGYDEQHFRLTGETKLLEESE